MIRERARLDALHIQDVMQGHIPWGPPPSHADMQQAIISIPKTHPRLLTISFETLAQPMHDGTEKMKLTRY